MKKTNLKKLIAGLSSACVIASSIPAVYSSAADPSSLPLGDVNQSGGVEVSDAVLILQSLANPTAYALSSEQSDLADVFLRGDGVDAQDALAIQMYLADLADVLPVSYSEGYEPQTETGLIHLRTNSITTEGDNLIVEGITVKITASGVYNVDGDLTNGQIFIETPADDTGDVEIVLNGVSMTSDTAPCIYSSAASGSDKTKITVIGDCTLTDTASAAYADAGVIFTNNKLTVTKNSTGTLNINSSMNAGINSEKKINLNGGTISVNTDDSTTDAVNECDADGIKSDKNIEIEGASVKVKSSADGIKSDGGVYLIDGIVEVKAGNDAVQAASEIAVSGGTITASGDRGFRLDEKGLLNITGGTVVATATDYQVNGNEIIDMSGSTQTIMLLDMAQEQPKSVTAAYGVEYTSLKKYSYMLISSPQLDTVNTNQLMLGGQTAQHDGGNTVFSPNPGEVTEYKLVMPVSTEGPESDPTAEGYTITLGSKISTNAPESVISINGSTATILQPAEVSVTGEMSGGQIVVNVDKTAYPDAIVEISLEGMNLSNTADSPIYVESCGDECRISAKNGTVNTITDGTSYTNADGDSGAVYSKDDLKIKGKGTLIVNGNCQDGIVSKDDLKIWNGNVTVKAVDDALRGKDSVKIGDPESTDFSSLILKAESTSGDGIKSSNGTDEGKGIVEINGGTVNINAYADGVQAEQEFVMNGGDVTINTYQGSSFTGTASGNTGSTGGWGPGGSGGGMGMDGNANKTDISAKGIKAVGIYDSTGTTYQSGGNITINGGTLNIDSSDDSVHSGGDMYLYGGTMKLASADDACHSDHTLNIGKSSADTYNDVVVYVTKCYEGIEGMTINQNSGTVVVNSTDDGYNAAGGTDGSGNTSPGGWNQGGGFGGGNTGSYAINLKGGFGLVNATDGDHDGFDSNGSLTITGGIFVSNGNEPFDSDGTLSYTGGIYIIDKGSSGGMGGGMGGGSSLASTLTATASATAGTRISLVDGSTVLVSFLADKSVSSLTAGCNKNTGAAFWTGGDVTGGTQLASGLGSQSIYVGGTLSGGTRK